MTQPQQAPAETKPRTEKLGHYLLSAEGGEVTKQLEGVTLRQARKAAVELSEQHKTPVTLYENLGSTSAQKVYTFGA